MTYNFSSTIIYLTNKINKIVFLIVCKQKCKGTYKNKQ